MRDALLILAFGFIISVSMGVSYGLAIVGEPQSNWLWCRIFHLCEVR